MMQPFVVGRESSIKALEAALASPAKRLFLAAQRDPQLDEPRPEDIFDVGVIATVAQSLKLPNGHIKVMVEGVRRGRIMAFERRGEYLSVAVEPMPLRPADVESLKEYMAKVLVALRAVRQALAPPRVRGARRVAEDRRPGAFRRHAVGSPRGRHRREAGAARGRVSVRASPEAPGPAGGRDRQGQHRPPDQQQGQEADGEGPEGVLPQREDQGDPPGARAQGRPDRRGRGAEEEDRDLGHAQGGPGEGRDGAAAPRGDAARLRGGDGLAKLHRVARRACPGRSRRGSRRT